MTGLFAALAAGLLGSPHCAGMCGPFAATSHGAGELSAWHAGRVATYAAIGAVAGALGARVPGPSWVTTVVSLGLLAWSCAVLAGLVHPHTITIPGLGRVGSAAARRSGVASRFVLGAVNALLPCGLVASAVAMAVALGSSALGAAAMTAFGLGTVPLLSAVVWGARRSITVHPWVRRGVAAVVLVAGVHAVSVRTAPAGPACHDHAAVR